MAKLQVASKFYGNCVAKAATAAQLTSSITLFTITGGPLRVLSMGMWVSTALPAGANTLKFRFTPDGGSLTDLSGATDTASAGANQLFLLDGVKATGPVKTTDVGILAAGQTLNMTNIVLGPGVVYAVFSAGPPASGAAQFWMEYRPLSSFTGVQIN